MMMGRLPWPPGFLMIRRISHCGPSRIRFLIAARLGGLLMPVSKRR
jgi:hypothetical protein